MKKPKTITLGQDLIYGETPLGAICLIGTAKWKIETRKETFLVIGTTTEVIEDVIQLKNDSFGEHPAFRSGMTYDDFRAWFNLQHGNTFPERWIVQVNGSPDEGHEIAVVNKNHVNHVQLAWGWGDDHKIIVSHTNKPCSQMVWAAAIKSAHAVCKKLNSKLK